MLLNDKFGPYNLKKKLEYSRYDFKVLNLIFTI